MRRSEETNSVGKKVRKLTVYCGEPHLCGQLPKQHTSKPVYVVVDNSYTVNLICIIIVYRNIPQSIASSCLTYLLVCLGYFHTGSEETDSA
jgi:hypothetical protein